MILRASAAWTFLTVLSAPIVPVTAQAPRDQHEAHQLHQDPKASIAALGDPRRDAYQKPHEVLDALGIKPGEIAREDLIRQMEAHGFRVATEHTFPPYQYFVVFEAAR